MKLKQLNRHLDFSPQRQWPLTMPCFAWKGQLLCGFDRTEGTAVEVEESLTEIFPQLHPKLLLSELARIFPLLEALLDPTEYSDLLKHYGFKNSERSKNFFQTLNSLPSWFLNWCDEKQPGANELSILSSFQSFQELEPVLKKIVDEEFSKSLGVKSLELAGELVLTGKKALVYESLSLAPADAWVRELKRLRYPLTSSRQSNKQRQLKNIPWPKNTSMHLKQHGDRDLLELRIQAGSLKDLSEKLLQIKQLTDKNIGVQQ